MSNVKHRFPLNADNAIALQEVETKRANFLEGINLRHAHEAKNATVNADGVSSAKSMLSFLEGMRKKARELDAFSLGYAIAHNIDYPTVFLNQRVEGKLANIYAITKNVMLGKLLNGGSWDDSSDSRTLAITILNFDSAGTFGGSKTVGNCDDLARKWGMGGGTYHNMGTQSVSSLRALHALGIVEKNGTGHKITNAPYFAYLLKGAKRYADSMSQRV